MAGKHNNSSAIRGFTMIDLMVSLALMGVVSAIAVPLYTEMADRSRMGAALSDLQRIELAIENFRSENFSLPDSLDELGTIPRTDAWGNAYSYLRIEGSTDPGVRGAQRKDKNLNPLNSDFDLFSPGPDQKTKPPLTAADSLDDLIRAGNGGFFGIAADH